MENSLSSRLPIGSKLLIWKNRILHTVSTLSEISYSEREKAWICQISCSGAKMWAKKESGKQWKFAKKVKI